jgi:hypothetical protein
MIPRMRLNSSSDSVINSGARRYALFALVGIAGEDDIDAPDLNAPTTTSASGADKPAPQTNGRLNGGRGQSPQQFPDDQRTGYRGAKVLPRPSPALLDPEASAALREQLAAELNGIDSADQAATWAHRVLGPKASLTATDAKQIEKAFRERLATFESPPPSRKGRPRNVSRPSGADRIDESELAHPKTRRVRDREHVRFVTKQPCLMCGRRPSDPHHLRFAQHRALGRKVSDEFIVRSAVAIIAKSIAVATKRHGGKKQASIRAPPPARCGCTRIRWRRGPRK